MQHRKSYTASQSQRRGKDDGGYIIAKEGAQLGRTDRPSMGKAVEKRAGNRRENAKRSGRARATLA